MSIFINLSQTYIKVIALIMIHNKTNGENVCIVTMNKTR